MGERWKVVVCWRNTHEDILFAATEFVPSAALAQQRSDVLSGMAEGSRPYGDTIEHDSVSVSVVREVNDGYVTGDGVRHDKWVAAQDPERETVLAHAGATGLQEARAALRSSSHCPVGPYDMGVEDQGVSR